jgi:hypothetical protein
VWPSITTLTEKHQRLQQKKMKQVFAILAVLIFSKTSYAQNIRGLWTLPPSNDALARKDNSFMPALLTYFGQYFHQDGEYYDA